MISLLLRVVPSRIPNLARNHGQYQDFGFVRAKRQRNVASKSRNFVERLKRALYKMQICDICDIATFFQHFGVC